LREATDLCGRLDRPRGLDTVGNRGFSGAANAARGHAPQGAPALILMGDWCAAAQPMIENQVCGDLGGWEYGIQAGQGKNAGTVAVTRSSLLTEVANG